MRQVLRDEWGFEGFVVSDWDAIRELTVHGFSADDREAVQAAISAGINMEMASSLYKEQLPSLVSDGEVAETALDDLVYGILKLKFELGLFDNPYTNPDDFPHLVNDEHRRAAKNAALRSCVLLKNEQQVLPLQVDQLRSIAVIGPLADDGYEQLGTWVFDGESHHSHTCLQAIHDLVGDKVDIRWARGLQSSRCREHDGHHEAIQLAEESDVAILFMGEESILSGEAHCRAEIDLPGSQEVLIEQIAATGTPVVLVVMAGRPLTLGSILDKVSSVLYAWHPGTMGGPAIADLLFGEQSPSGKLPVSFPRMVGQVPIYYARKNTGRPPSHDNITHIDEIDGRAEQTSLGMSAFHLDAGFTPLFPFGYGLSYTHFEYRDINRSQQSIALGESITLSATVQNCGDRDAEEIVQLYIRDVAGNVTRPVRELKGFRRVTLAAGESKQVSFDIDTNELAFHNRKMELVTEPGAFHVWIGGDSNAQLQTDFEVHE
jgi:beta-glucosidase